MEKADRLIKRLDEIAAALKNSGQGRALLALGSAGNELNRLDRYSDLDFFVIVAPGSKENFLARLDWLSEIAPLAYYFRNTVDGYKLLFADEIFCEFAVFEPAELSQIPFAEGRIVWHAEDFDSSICMPAKFAAVEKRSQEWLLGEALTNLYIGLARYRRGEKLSGVRFIENHSVDRILELAEMIEAEQRDIAADPFTRERRFEQRFPQLAKELPKFIQGYEHAVASAREIIAFLERNFTINSAMKQLLTSLCQIDVVSK